MIGILKGAIAFGVVWSLMGCARPNLSASGTAAEIVLRAPRARQVDFACSCQRFRPRPALPKGSGTWSVWVDAHTGFSYFFIVDGRVMLPECDLKQQDDFGAQSCIYQFDP